jgi:nucleoside 2-deoxyribosyltransferase
VKLYIAGPLFTSAERTFNADLASKLAVLGYEVWLPQDNEPREKTAAAIFAKDVEGIDWADAVVANMDGPDPDSGTAWECGYAYAKRKPVILFRTDFRGANDGDAFVNLMLFASATVALKLPFASVGEVAKRVHAELVKS